MDNFDGFSPFDSTMIKKWESDKKYEYKNIDNLAKTYKNVTFVIAYQRTNDVTDAIIKKYNTETKNLLYLKGMNKLLSGFFNSKHQKGMSFPTSFILNKDGKVIYESKSIVEENFFTNQFLKTLPK